MSTRVPTPDSQPEDLLTSGEVGELLNVSSETIRRWAESGKIAVAKTVNGRRYFDRATVESFGDEQPLTISEAAKELGVSVSTLRRYEKKGILVPERSESGQRAYDRAKIKNFDKTSAVKATRTQVATPIVVAEPLGAAPAPVVEPSEEPLPTRAKEKDPVRALGERFSLVSLGGVVVLFVLTFAMVRSLIAIPTDEELQHERQRLAQRYANNGGDGGSTAGFSSNPTGEANDSDATASVAAGDEEDEQSEARVAGLQIETNTLDGLYDAEPGIQRDITVNDGALSIDVYAKAKELLVDLREDHTRFQVQDHETPVFTIDSNKKITTHAGSTLDLNGALQLQGEGPEKDNQFIVASPGVAPQWETFGSLAAKGGLDCEDCLTEQHIPDIYLKNTTDTFSGQLTLSTPEDTPVLILQDTTNNDTAQVYTGTGSPDGVLSAPAGSLFLDQSGATYVNTNNATSWTDLSSGGGGSSKWTDSGTITYLTATTDDVAVGGSTLAASIFSIDQSAGTFLFGGDQSANPTLTFEATDSDTGDFGFNTSDAFFFSGANVGIGDTSPAALFTVGSSDAFQVDNSGNITTAGDLAVNGDDITADGDLTLNPAGGNVIIADADVLDVYGVTIGLNNDADADNLLGLSAAAGEASSDLYWGDDLLCDISETNCGGGSSLFTDGGAITYLTSATDDLALGGSASTSPFFFDESEEQLNINNSTTNAGVLLNQDGNGAALSIDSESTSANVIDLATNTPTTTTGNIIDIQANALTSGSLLDLVSNSSNTSTRSLVNILNDNTSATGATVLTLEQDAAERVAFFNQDADGIALEIDTEATTANVIDISNPQTTTGNVLNLNNVSSLTTGSIGYFRSGGADTSTRSLVYIVNDNPSATGATALEVDQDAAQRGLFLNQDGDGNALEIDSQATSADVINIATPATTTGDVIDIDADALTTGSIINADSNSSDTSTRYLVNIINDNTAATGAVGLRIQQDSTGDIIELYDGASEVFTVDDQGALIIAPASAVTTAIDVSDSDITNALSIGTNTITGTSGVIDFTAFDVAGTGAVTIAPTSSLTTAIDLTDSDITNAISLGQNTILGTTGVIDFNQFDVSGTGVVINEGASTAVDVRIEGASETHLFFVDASTDRVGIGISSPEQTLHVRGPDSAGSIGAYIDNSQAHGLLVEAGNSSSEYILRLQDGSAAHVLEVRHTGELGLGTSSPGDLLHIADDNSATNSVVDLFRIELTSTGTPAAGLGSGVVFHIEDAGGSEEQASIDTILTTVTDGSEVSDIIFSVQQSGAITELARFDGSGDQLDLSGSLNLGDTDSSITGTTAVINFTNFDVSSTGEITLAAGAGLDTNGAGVLDLGVTNATSIVAGAGSLTSFTITTDGTGDTEVELPDGSINTDEILDATILTGDIAADTILELNLDAVDTPSDEECLTYESGAGGDFEWQACAGGSTSLDDAYNNGQSITVDTADILLDLNDSTNDYGLVIDNNTASTIDTGLEFTSAGGGALTTAIDASAALIGNALSIGANTILGTTGVIDFTDFDVSNDGAVTIANDGNVVSLTIDSAATTGDVVQINDAQITGGNVLEIQNADALTTGSIASFMSDGTDTSTRSLVEIINENTAATGATGLTVRQDADERAVFIDQNGDSVGLSIDTEATTSAALRIASPTHTTGNVIEVTSANSLTNGSILDLTSNSSSTTTRNLAVIHNDNTAATGATVLSLRQDADQRALFINQDANGSGIEIDSEATSAAAIAVDSAATTTGNIIQVDTANSLTTGSIAYFRSNGSDTSTRHLVNIINDNTAATGAVGLRIQQDSTGDILELYDGSNEVFTVDDQGALIIAPATATTTAIDVSDSDITNALSVGANTITGTSAVIDFNNFDVAASGAITISPSSALTTGIDLTDTDLTNALSIGDNTILGTAAVIDFTDFDLSADGLIVLTPDDGGDAFTLTPSAAITDALDVSNALITNALNIGANTIVGTTGVIDFTNFDVSTVGSITAQESTATHIFGDAASLEIPNSTGPTVNAAGEIAVDTTNDQIKYYGGAERVLTYQKKFGATIESPAANVDNFNLLKAPYALTITDIECIVDPADSSESVVIDIEERDSTGDSPATVDATITCDNDGASDDGSLSNGTIDSGDWVSIDIGAVTGTVTQVTVTITYTVDGT